MMKTRRAGVRLFRDPDDYRDAVVKGNSATWRARLIAIVSER
jgi:hypothetical protein